MKSHLKPSHRRTRLHVTQPTAANNMPDQHDEATATARAQWAKNTASSICFGNASPAPAKRAAAAPTAASPEEKDEHDSNCEQAAAVWKKNTTSTISFGIDSAVIRSDSRPEHFLSKPEMPAASPAASPATIAALRGARSRSMMEGHDEAFAWEAGGSPSDTVRNHAPLHANPEFHVKDRNENRAANTTSSFSIGADLPTMIVPSRKRAHGTTKEEADRLATRLTSAQASPHTMKKRELGEHKQSFNDAEFNSAASPVVHTARKDARSQLVLGTSESVRHAVPRFPLNSLGSTLSTPRQSVESVQRACSTHHNSLPRGASDRLCSCFPADAQPHQAAQDSDGRRGRGARARGARLRRPQQQGKVRAPIF